MCEEIHARGYFYINKIIFKYLSFLNKVLGFYLVMNFQGISIPVNSKIKTIDPVIVSLCKKKIIDNIRSEFFTALKNNDLSISIIHQLSSETVLIQVDVMDEIDPQHIIGATLFVLNLSTECHQIYIINLMNLRHELSNIDGVIKVDQDGSGKIYKMSGARVFFESICFSLHLITKIRAVVLIEYESCEGEIKKLLIPGKDNEITLTGTREQNTGKVFYFPATYKPA